MNPISSTNSISNALAGDYSSLLGSAGSSSTDFDSIFSQAMSAAKTPAQQAQVDFAEVQYSNLNSLASMFDTSDSSDDPSSLAGLASLLGDNNPFSSTPPAWETDLANLLGPNSTAAQALSLDQQASLASQSLFSSDLSSLGSGVDSVI